MKLESLKLEKFKPEALKKEQMLKLNGGLALAGTVTAGGSGCANNLFASDPATFYQITYGYDADRIDENGNLYRTYHNRTYCEKILASDCC